MFLKLNYNRVSAFFKKLQKFENLFNFIFFYQLYAYTIVLTSVSFKWVIMRYCNLRQFSIVKDSFRKSELIGLFWIGKNSEKFKKNIFLFNLKKHINKKSF